MFNKSDPNMLRMLEEGVKKEKKEKQARNNPTPTHSTTPTNNQKKSSTTTRTAHQSSNKSDPTMIRRLEMQVAQEKAERKKTPTTKKYTNTPATQIVLPENTSSYGMTKAEYDMRRSSNPTMPEYGSYDYYKNREETLRPLMEEIAEDFDRQDPTYKAWVENYRAGLMPDDVNDYTREKVISLSNKFKRQDAIIAEYKDINAQLEKFDKKGIHINESGEIDTKSGAEESKYAKDRYRTILGADALTTLEMAQGFAGQLPEDKQKGYDERESMAHLGLIEEQKEGAYNYYEKNKNKVYEDNLGGRLSGNYKIGRIGIKSNQAGYTSFNATSEDIEASEVYQALGYRIQNRNKETFKNNGATDEIIATIGQYAPQGVDQAVIGTVGKIIGGLVGSKSAGKATATALYMYEQTAGATYVRLLQESDLSVEDAKKLAQSEALSSAAVEFGLDFATSKLWSKVGSTSVAKNATSGAGATLTKALRSMGISEKGAKTILNVAKNTGKLILNSMGEGGEEWWQEGISITADRYATEGETASPFKLLVQSLWLPQYSKDDFNRMNKSFMGGAIIGFGQGGVDALSSYGINKTISKFAEAKTVEAQNEVVDFIRNDEETLNALIEEGKASGEGTVSEKIATEIEIARENGKEVTREQVKKLIASNETYIKAEEQASTPDPIEQAAREVVANRNRKSTPSYERLEALSQNNEPITADEVKKVTGFGDEGSKLVTDLANKEGVTFSQAERAVKTAYMAGRTNVDSTKVNFVTDEQINAFTAGKKDSLNEILARKENAKNIVVNKQSGFSKENLPSDVTQTQAEIVDMIFKSVGVRGYVTNGLKGNAEINKKTGEVAIDFDFEREVGSKDNRQKVSIVYHAAHEAAMHRARELAPEEMSAFMYELYKHLAGNEPSTYTLADQKREAYAKQGVELSLDGSIEEITANNLLYLYNNNETKFKKAIESIANGTNTKAKQGLAKWIECLKEIFAKISDFLLGKNVKESAEIRAEVARIRDMFETGLAKAVENKKAIENGTQERNADTNSSKNLEIKINEDYNGNINHSLKDGANIETIKNLIQSIKGRAGLKYDGGRIISIPNNDMATLRHKFMTQHHYSNRSGGIIDCIDCFGQGGKKHYFYIFYVGEYNRVAPIFRLDYQYIERYIDDVQKISNEMGYNKDEFIDTTSGNGKGIDRIRNLSKSDSVYDVSDAREKPNNRSGEVYNDAGREGETDNRRDDVGVSNGYNEQSDNREIDDNTSFSLKDSEGNTLTKEQQEYFKDSQVRDENGNLLVVYHGSPAKFTIFKHDHLNTNGNSHGRGFYFTENQSRAEGYSEEGGQLLKGYLNISNPLSEDKVTIKKTDLLKLIKATCKEEAQRLVDDDGYDSINDALLDTWISNYVNTYEMSINDAYREAANIIYSGNDNDVEIIAEITNAGAGNEATLRLTNDILGYDGVIYTANDGTHEFVSLVSNQFKSVDNAKPTTNPDIHYSLKDSEGKSLSKEQAEFFKNSKIRDKDGNLLVMYHGTTRGGFTVFGGRKDHWYFTNDKKYAYAFEGRKKNGQFFPYTKERMENGEITPQRYKVYLNVTNPYIADIDTVEDALYWDKSLAGLLRDKGYDALMVEDMSQVIVLNANQIKNTTNKKPTSDPDINFSLKGTNDINTKDRKELLDIIEHLKGEFELTKFAKADSKKLAKMTKDLLKEYDSQVDYDETFKAIDELYQYMANGEEGHPAVWEEVYNKAYDIAQNIVKNALVVDDTMYQTYSGLRNYLRTTPMKFYAGYDSVPSSYENFNDFRKMNMGRLKFTNDGMPIDKVYQELAELYPEFFDTDRDINTEAQLETIVDVLDGLKATEINPFDGQIRQASMHLATDITSRFFDIPQAKPTFADKAERRVVDATIKGAKKVEAVRQQKEAKIKKLMEAQREKTKKQLDKLREQRDTKVRKEQEKRRVAISKMSETQKARELRAKIIHHTGELNKTLLKATDKKHIPPELENAVLAVLYNINLESSYSYDVESGSYKKNDAGLPTKKTEAFRELKAVYEEIAKNNDYGLTIASELFDMTGEGVKNIFDEVMELSEKRIADMTSSELTKIYDMIRLVEHSIATANKMFAMQKWENLTETAKAFEKSVATRRAKHALMKSHYTLDIENPITFFSHFGEAGEELYQALREAQDNEQEMIDELAEHIQGIISLEEMQNAEKEIYEFTTIEGKKLTLSKAHIMDIYLLYNRNQGKKHLLYDPDNNYFGNGIHQPKIKGKKIRRDAESTRLTKVDLGNILSKLSESDKAIADKMQKATLLLAEWGNKACLRVFGYEKFKDPDYWTIKSARESINQTIEKNKDQARSIKNMGSAKSVEAKATNALDIGGVFNVFNQHASDMICYSAWLEVMEDATKLYNYTFRDANGNKTSRTFDSMLEKYAGEGGSKYYFNLMKDIQNGIGTAPDTATEQIYTKLFGKAAKAKVAYKLTVVAQQPMAIVRASTVLNPLSIMQASIKGGLNLPVWTVSKVKNLVTKEGVQESEWYGGWQRALKYAPIASRKAIGGYEINSNSTGLKGVLYKPKTVKGKTVDALKESPLWAAGKADEITWGVLWNACEIETRRNTDLEKGSDAYYEAVKNLFDKVINETQVVDGVLQRSQLMRSSSGWIKPLTTFKGEPTMALNGVIRAYDKLRYETDSAKRGKVIKAFSRATTVFVASAIFTAFARSLAVGLTGEDDEEYWKKVWKSFSGIQGDEETWFDYVKNIGLKSDVVNNMNPLSWLPITSEMMSAFQGYDVERLDVASIGEFVNAGTTFINSLDDEGKNTVTYATRNLLLKFAELTGYSPYNLVRDIEGAIRTTRTETNDVRGLYDMEKWRTKPASNVSKYVDILYKAYNTDREAYEYIYNDMLESGVSAEKIERGMETRMKKSEGVKEASDLSKRYMTPEDEKQYDRSLNKIKSSRAWQSANATQRKNAKADLYDFLTSTTEDMVKTRAEAKEYGVDETEYTLWQLAIEMADQPKGQKGNGSYDYKEKAEAINSLNLGEEEIAYFFGKGLTETGKEELNEALDLGIGMQEYVNFKAATSEMKADKNAQGKSIPNSKKRKVVNYLNNADLTREEWEYFYYEVMNYKK